MDLSMYRLSSGKEMTPRVAQHLYIKLEKDYNELTEKNKKTTNKRQRSLISTHKKRIRKEQNLLYPMLVKGTLVNETQEMLGFRRTSQVLYKRKKAQE